MAVSSAGQFYANGTATAQPNPTGFSGRIKDVAITADGRGAVALSSRGQFYAYGTAAPQPNPTGFDGEMEAVAVTADGQGLVAVSSAGQLYAYGTAVARPNPIGFTGRIVDVDLTADGRGMIVVSSSGQAYHYGSVVPRGNADPGNTAGGTRTVLAQQILNSATVLATAHASGRTDDAFARNNIVDTANGRPAQRSSYQNAPGGSVYLDTRMLQGLADISASHRVRVSEIAGGSHSPGSRHYAGTAFDLDRVDGSGAGGNSMDYRIAKPVIDICKRHGSTLAILEPTGGGSSTSFGNHVHCQW